MTLVSVFVIIIQINTALKGVDMSNTSSSALLGNDPLPLDRLLADSIIVQDYPEKYVSPPRGKPRVHHDSYCDAKSQGFVYGLRTNNGSNNWTRLVLVKPSEDVLKVWEQKIGSKIEAITFDEFGKDSGVHALRATHMEGVGRITLGYVASTSVEELKKAAWSKNLGDMA